MSLIVGFFVCMGIVFVALALVTVFALCRTAAGSDKDMKGPKE